MGLARSTTDAGSIPAYAGEPYRDYIGTPIGKVYPRVCGGTEFIQIGTDYNKGLSPRMRGNPLPNRKNRAVSRSIPAYAGEPLSQPVFYLDIKVYPRVCGGTCDKHLHTIRIKGLSPRMRGNPLLNWVGPIRKRSIPAYAGEPRCLICKCRDGEVYPRVCGGTWQPHGRRKAR